MNKNRKRILCCVLSLLMLFSLLPLSAFAEEQLDAALTGADGAADPAAQEALSPVDASSSREEESLPEESTPAESTPPEEGAPSDETVPPDAPGADAPADEPVCDLPEEDAEGADGAGDGEEPEEALPAEPSEELLLVWQLLAELPTADGIAGMSEEELAALDELLSRILDVYDLLSEEEQALVDLSPLEALTASFGAQTFAAYTPVTLETTYTSTADPNGDGFHYSFTLAASGGKGPFKYSIGSIMVKTAGGVYFELDRTKKSYTSALDTRAYDFKHTFVSSGTYYFDTYVMDMGVSPVVISKYRVEFTIDDPQYPSIDQMVEQIYQDCEAQGFTTDYEKALFYHDWIIDNADYDNSYSYAGAGGVLCRGLGTCQSYHDALVMLLKRSGIPCGGSTGNGHIWTRVCLDGVWTLIDSTWDDTVVSPSDPTADYRRHMYFGITDELMTVAHDEHKVDPAQRCDSLAKNYMILTTDESRSIRRMSDPIKSKIEALGPGTHTIPAAPDGFYIADVYYKNLCPIAAYYLENYDFADSGITVTYNQTDKTYSVFKPCRAHNLETLPAVAPTCIDTGLTAGEHCTVCGLVTVPQETVPITGHTPVIDPAVAPSGFAPGLTEGSHCSVCKETLVAQEEYFDTVLVLPSGELSGGDFWADGVRLGSDDVLEKDGKTYLQLSRSDASTLVTYTYNTVSADPHEVYPVGMKVWMLGRNDSGYTAAYLPAFDDLLQYGGSSIRITGVTGIRMITGLRREVKSALTGRGLEGYTLLEYGTVLGLAREVSASSLVLDHPNAKHNYAYKRGVADPVFATAGGVTQYTNVLVGFSAEQCKEDIVMRPYIVLRSADGREVTLYGGVVQRSIGYIAYQNRSVFSPGSSAYNYVWDIIRNVYGNRYDSEHEG